jgi:hypothetical protein
MGTSTSFMSHESGFPKALEIASNGHIRTILVPLRTGLEHEIRLRYRARVHSTLCLSHVASRYAYLAHQVLAEIGFEVE